MSKQLGVNHQIPIPKLDPLRVGEVMGSDAFCEGDWVLLRTCENRPTKVINLEKGLIFVDPGMGESFEDTLLYFYPEELGYPLDYRFWSRHQKQCYVRCHIDCTLSRRWDGTSQVIGKSTQLKLLLLFVFASVFALAVSGFWTHYPLYRGFRDGLANALNP